MYQPLVVKPQFKYRWQLDRPSQLNSSAKAAHIEHLNNDSILLPGCDQTASFADLFAGHFTAVPRMLFHVAPLNALRPKRFAALYVLARRIAISFRR